MFYNYHMKLFKRKKQKEDLTFEGKLKTVLTKQGISLEEKYSNVIQLYCDYFKYDLLFDSEFYTKDGFYDEYMIDGMKHELRYQRIYQEIYDSIAYDTLYEFYFISRHFVLEGINQDMLNAHDKKVFVELNKVAKNCNFHDENGFNYNKNFIDNYHERKAIMSHINNFLSEVAEPIKNSQYPDSKEIFGI